MNPKTWDVPSTIALIFVVSFNALLGFVTWKDPTGQNTQIMIGAMVATISGIVGFYFGSSTSSKAKDETIAHLSQPNGGSKP